MKKVVKNMDNSEYKKFKINLQYLSHFCNDFYGTNKSGGSVKRPFW